MKMIIDFIKSWLYYPKMRQWLMDRNCVRFHGRFQYAYKHCRMKNVSKKKRKIMIFLNGLVNISKNRFVRSEDMLIVAKKDDIDDLYAIWNTVTDRFIGVNLGKYEAVRF